MNIDAKKLIAKGMKYDDMELVEEGYALLEQQEQDKTVMPPIDEITIIDTEVHKRGASKIISNEVVGEPLLHKKDDFNFQIRDEDNSKYTRSVPIDFLASIFISYTSLSSVDLLCVFPLY